MIVSRVPLGDVLAEAVPGFASGERTGDGVIQVRMNCVSTDGGLDLTVAPRIPHIPRLERYLLEPGDVVFNATSSQELVGKTALFTGWPEPVTFSNHFLRIRVRSGKLEPAYLTRWLTWNQRRGTFAAICARWVNQAVVRQDRLLTLKIPLPPLAEQGRIAAVLDKAAAVRRKRRESLRLLGEFLRSAFLEMFGDPVRNEKGWEVASLGNLLPERSLIVDGPFGSSLKPDSYVESGVRVIRNFNIKDDAFDHSAFKYITAAKFEEVKRSEVKASDVLISTKGTLGNVCLMPDLPGDSVLSASGTVRLRVPGESEVRRQFLVAQMVTAPFKRYLKRFEAGTNQKYLNLASIRKLEVILPPVEMQDRYQQLRNGVLRVKARHDAAIDASDALFDSLAQRAFREEL